MTLAIRQKKAQPEVQALAASAVRVTSSDPSWPVWRRADESWSQAAWNFYDCGGELHYSADYVGAGMSLIRKYIGKYDEQGKLVEVKDDKTIVGLSNDMFGGPQRRKELQRRYGIAMSVAGRTWIIGKPGKPNKPRTDTWMIAGPNRVRPLGNNQVTIDAGDGVWETLSTRKNVVIQSWTPHPDRPYTADSPVRALLGTFEQLQQLRLFISSQLRSRIAWASVLFIPSGLQFPREDNKPQGALGFMELLAEAMTANLTGKGTAAAYAPIVAEVPDPSVMPTKPLTFDSPLSDQAVELRRELREDIARGMNVPANVVNGNQDRSNHWSAYFGSEEFITKTIQPIDNQFNADAYDAYVSGLMIKLGYDPDEYGIGSDYSPLMGTVDKFADAFNLWKEGGMSLAAVLTYGDFQLEDEPSKEELAFRRLWEVVLRDPTRLESEAVRQYLGLEIESFLPEIAAPDGPPPPPRPDTGDMPQPIGSKPTKPARSDMEIEEPLMASLVPAGSQVLIASNAAVVAALNLAGKRLLTRQLRGQFPNTKPSALHTVIQVTDNDHAEKLLASAWDDMDDLFAGVVLDANDYRNALHQYAQNLLVRGIEHSRSLLAAFLKEGGLL